MPARTGTLTHVRGLVAAAAALGALAFAAPAMASSLVYTKDGNVWLARPDGSGQYQVTTDGTAADPYEWPTQADDGTIVASRGTRLYRMAQNGVLLSPPADTLATLSPFGVQSGPFAPVVSPDGKSVAYWFALYAPGPFDAACACNRPQLVSTYVHAQDAATGASIGDVSAAGANIQDPSWVGNDQLLVFAPFNISASQTVIVAPGQTPGGWFADRDITGDLFNEVLSAGALSRAGDQLALVRGSNVTDDAASATIQLLSVTNTTTLPAVRCTIGPDPSAPFSRLSWAPDGSGLAWSEQDGVHVTPVTSAADCGAAPALVIPGGAMPYWGPADVNPAPRPAPTTPATPTTPTTTPTTPATPATPTGPAPVPTPQPTPTSQVPAQTDAVPPLLRALTVARTRGRVLVRLRLSEAGSVSGTLQRLAGRAHGMPRYARVRSVRLTLRATSGRLALGRLKAGRYRLALTLVDAAGNRRAVIRAFAVR